jgi:hypothetical protein
MTWARWIETAERHVGKTSSGRSMCLDGLPRHDQAFGGGPPLLWETMIFGPEGHELTGYQRRYTTRAAALEGHAQALALVRSAGN